MSKISQEIIDSLFPFDPHFVDVSGGRMHYVDEGSGEPVVLLHGNPTWSFLYRKFIPPLAERFRVVAPDYIGFGKSDKLPHWRDYSIKLHVNNLESLIAHLGLRGVTLVLQDWGGPIGLGYGARHPENVARLIVFNTVGTTPKPEQLRLPLPLRLFRTRGLGEILVQGMNFFVERFMPMATAQKDKLTKEVLDGYRYPFPDWSSRAGVLAFPRLIPSKMDDEVFELAREVDEKFWPRFRGRALVVWPMKDVAFTPNYLEDWKRLLPDAEFRILEDVGHYLQEEEPEAVVEWIMEFLQGPMSAPLNDF